MKFNLRNLYTLAIVAVLCSVAGVSFADTPVAVTGVAVPAVDYSAQFPLLLTAAGAIIAGGAGVILAMTGGFSGFEWLRGQVKKRTMGK